MRYNYEPTFRQAFRPVARSGGQSWKLLWGTFLIVAVLFWPSIFMHGGGRIVAESLWYSFEGIIALILAAAYVHDVRQRKMIARAIARHDLRDSDEFTGR